MKALSTIHVIFLQIMYVNIDFITMPTGEKPMHNFVKRNVKCSPMHIAAERSNLKLCEHIMDRIVVDNNRKDLVGETSFHWAPSRSYARSLQSL